MGVSLEQYRSAIGKFNGGSHQFKDNSSSLYSDNISDSSPSIQPLDKYCVAKGPWKLHLSVIVFLLLSPMTSMIVGSCHDILLIRSGIESNPGPTQTKDLTKHKEILAELCANAPKMESTKATISEYAIRDCIRLFNVNTLHDMKAKRFRTKFSSVDSDVLRGTINYLNGPDMSEYTKEACIDKVIAMIDHYLPHKCNMCNDDHSISLGEQSLLNCDKCGRGIHQQCLLKHLNHASVHDNTGLPSQEEVTSMTNPSSLPGLRYLCGSCDAKLIPSSAQGKYKRLVKKRSDNDQSTETTSSSQENAAAGESQPASTSAQPSIVIDDDDDDLPPVLRHFDEDPPHNAANQSDQNKTATKSHNDQTETKTICRFYRQNRCKHGITGHGIPGTQCKFDHPKPCIRFTAHGTGSGGCREGLKCSKFHPRMCRDSLRKNECLNPDCTFPHVRGTRRSQADKNDYHNKEANNRGNHTDPATNLPPAASEEVFLDVLNRLKNELSIMIDQKFNQTNWTRHQMQPANRQQETNHLQWNQFPMQPQMIGNLPRFHQQVQGTSQMIPQMMY